MIEMGIANFNILIFVFKNKILYLSLYPMLEEYKIYI